MTAVALCAVGAEKVVSNELRKLGISVIDSRFGRVRFSADTAGLYRALIGLRAADRVLLEAGFFPAEDFDALYKGVNTIPWERYIPAAMGLKVDKVRAGRSRLEAVTSIQAVVHKAAAERLCRQYTLKRLPETAAPAEIRVYMEKDQVSLLLDLSGEPLFKRGYRLEGGVAPLRETTAAALILLTNWRRKYTLCDPFCGSGTIIIEAAMYAWDMAPGLGRRFVIQDLLIADKEIEERERQTFLGRVDFSRPIHIFGSDSDARAVNSARSNAERSYELALGKIPRKISNDNRPPLHLPGLPVFKTLAMQDVRPLEREDGLESGYIITNPPYGKRLGEKAGAEAAYAQMAVLARNFPGWKLGVICDHPGFESFFGRKAESCREISNGAVQLYFYQFEL
ncbi:MAG: class I SAM-dependent RNA methyltransferase [Treponema sp.]|jgi:putative N6-adenine-specific DNA methylase|nr:class I SAM-dependent RNA methyltransferase [Treponema sp.]